MSGATPHRSEHYHRAVAKITEALQEFYSNETSESDEIIMPGDWALAVGVSAITDGRPYYDVLLAASTHEHSAAGLLGFAKAQITHEVLGEADQGDDES